MRESRVVRMADQASYATMYATPSTTVTRGHLTDTIRAVTDIASRPCRPALDRLLPAIAPGPMLYVGCPEPAWLETLITFGFAPAIVGFPSSTVVQCRQALKDAGVGLEVHELDRSVLEMPNSLLPGSLAMAVLDGVLNQLWPDESDRLVATVRTLTQPGGVVCTAARTTDDPMFVHRREGVASVARNTFHLGEGRVERYVLPGELSASFGDWMILHAVEKPGQPTAQGHEVWAVVVARRPSGGTLLV